MAVCVEDVAKQNGRGTGPARACHSEGGARVRETEWLWRKVPCEPVDVASWRPPEEWSYQLELVDLSGRLAADVVASCHGTVRTLSL